VADAEALVRRVDEPASADHRPVRVLEESSVERVGGNLHHLIERDIVGFQALRVGLNLHHLQPLTPDGDVCHPGDA
jgi:hypothetical protein